MWCHRSVQARSIGLRNINTACPLRKSVPDNLRGKNKNAQEWLTRQLNDPYVKQTRYDNYRARSAYKLLELDDKFKLLRPGMITVDCGSAPGSWTQVLVRRVNANQARKDWPSGKVVSIDIMPFEPVAHALCFGEVDFLDENALKRIMQDCDPTSEFSCDVVVSDMAPKATGVTSMDHENVTTLCYAAFGFALRTLKPGGAFVCKQWFGNRTTVLKTDLKTHFEKVHIAKPDASRDDSAEIFLVATEFKGLK